MSPPLPRVVAIIAAYNEADIIGQVIDHFADEGVSVYLLDHGSTDATVQEAERRLDRNVIAVEPLPATPESAPRYSLRAILERKAELAQTLDADWIIHCDADEFRESPWLGTTLQQAIGIVGALGYNAIDFEVLSFFPTEPERAAGDDVRQALPWFEPSAAIDRVNVSCWRAGRRDVDLITSGGLDVGFAGRSVFPVPFLLRHYPLRDQAHAERKIFAERLARFDPEERKLGWHRQYDGLRPGQRFVRSPAQLLRFDPLQARIHLALRNREAERIEHEWRGALERHENDARHQLDELRELDQRLRATLRELDETRDGRARAEHHARAVEAAARAELAQVHVELAQARVEAEALRADRDAAEQLRRQLASVQAEARTAERALALAHEDRDVAMQRCAALDLQLSQAKRALLDSDRERRRSDEALRSARELLHAREQALHEAQAALARITDLEQRLRDVYMSLSWQVTHPLRRGIELVKGKRKADEP